MRIRNIATIALLASTILNSCLVGCSKTDQPLDRQLVAVTGQVTIGQRPISGVSVLFLPLEQGSRARGVTDSGGNYKLIEESESAGVAVGEYRVVFSKLVARSPHETDPIDASYQSPDSTPIRANVDPETRTLNFDLRPMNSKQ